MATSFTQSATSSGAAGPANLQLDFEEIWTELSDYLGWSRSPAGERLATVKRYANDGYRIFLMGIDPRSGKVHDWSFLAPGATLSVAAESTTTALPSDFRSILDDFAYGSNDSAKRLKHVSVVEIMTRRAGAGSWAGVPCLYAVQPASFESDTGQEYEVLWWPVPGRDYTLYYRYRANPGEMAESWERPMGGPEHVQTILQAGLMIAEARSNDGQTGSTVGYHKQLFEQLIAHSIDLDKRNGPASVGYNTDPSDDSRPILYRRGQVTHT